MHMVSAIIHVLHTLLDTPLQSKIVVRPKPDQTGRLRRPGFTYFLRVSSFLFILLRRGLTLSLLTWACSERSKFPWASGSKSTVLSLLCSTNTSSTSSTFVTTLIRAVDTPTYVHGHTSITCGSQIERLLQTTVDYDNCRLDMAEQTSFPMASDHRLKWNFFTELQVHCLV